MTQQEMIETVMATFDNAGEKRIRAMLNDANERFVFETRIIQDKTTKSHTPDTLEYDKSSFTNTAGGELLEIMSLEMQDFDNEDFRWYVEDNDTIVLGVLNDAGDKLNSIGTSGLTIEVHGIFSDPGFGDDLTAEPNYPNAFHRAVVSRVMEQLHAEKGNLRMTRYYKNDYEERVADAKKLVGSGGVYGDAKTFQSATDSKRIPG